MDDVLHRRLVSLETRAKQIKNNTAPTVPIYGTSTTSETEHIHQAATGYNDGGFLYHGGRNLAQVSDGAASDGVAVKWTTPSFSDFDTCFYDALATLGPNTNDVYDLQTSDMDDPAIDSSTFSGHVQFTVRVRGTDAGTTYHLTVSPTWNQDPSNINITLVSGGTSETVTDSQPGEIYNTQDWTGITDYVDLTWVVDFIPGRAMEILFFGWYSSGSGDVYLDKITLDWPV